MYNNELIDFVRESNRIEGIPYCTPEQVTAHQDFLLRGPSPESLMLLVGVLQPGAELRDQFGIPGVRVGKHTAPPSGPVIRARLKEILLLKDPWEKHCAYLTLHPFTDGNGRSARAIWLHDMSIDVWSIRRGFLHSFYYQTLAKADNRGS